MKRDERLREAFNYLKNKGVVHKQKDVAEKMGSTEPNVSAALKGAEHVLTDNFLMRFNQAFGNIFNDEWLRTGEGEMLNTPAPQAESGNTSGYETYLLPMSVMGGSLTGFAVDSVMPRDCEKIVSPIKGVDFAITIYGESMSPEYPSGSRVLVKKINPGLFIEWGKVYVLDTENGAIIKEVRKCKDKEGYVTCHSINPDPKYADFDVPLREVFGMYRVLMCLSAK